MKNLIIFGGVFHLVCGVSHLFYPRIFQWERNLKELADEKRRIIQENLRLSNYSMLIFWLILSFIPILYANELLSTRIGKALLTAIIIFWTIRIFIVQPIVAGIKSKESICRISFFMIGYLLFLVPWLNLS